MRRQRSRDISVEELPRWDSSVEYRFAGTDVFLQAQMTNHGKARIHLRRGDKEQYVDCVHSVLYKGPVEEMPETLSAEHANPSIKLPSAEVRFFALESFLQVVAELGFVAMRRSLIGNIASALESRLNELMGDSFYPLYYDTLAAFASDLPMQSEEWEEITSIFNVAARRYHQPSMQPFIDAIKRQNEWHAASRHWEDMAYNQAHLYENPAIHVPRRMPKLVRQSVAVIFGSMISAARKHVFERTRNRIPWRADGAKAEIPPHFLFKRKKSPFREYVTGATQFLVTGGVIDGNRVLGLQELIQESRKQVLKRAVLRRMRQSEGGIVHFWPHYLVKRAESPFHRVLNQEHWSPEEQDLLVVAKALQFESAIVEGTCWRYFRLGFTIKNYSFQETLWSFLTHEGWNDCYYRFKQKPPEKSVKFDRSWIMILDPWTDEEFPITSGGLRLRSFDIAETERQLRLPSRVSNGQDKPKPMPVKHPVRKMALYHSKSLLEYVKTITPVPAGTCGSLLPAKATPPHPVLPPPPAAAGKGQDGQVIPAGDTNPSKPLSEAGERAGDTLERGDTHE